MKLVETLFSLTVLAIVLTSCVSTKKYETLQQENATLQKRLGEAKQETKETQKMVEDEKASFLKQIDLIKSTKSDLEAEVSVLKKEKETLETRINTLIYDQANQSSTMAAEYKRLNEELSKIEEVLIAKENAVTLAQSEL